MQKKVWQKKKKVKGSVTARIQQRKKRKPRKKKMTMEKMMSKSTIPRRAQVQRIHLRRAWK